jgi:hypothetical protein
MRYTRSAALIAFTLLGSFRLAGQDLTLTNYQRIDQSKLTATQWATVYSADLVNHGSALATVKATVTSLSPNVVVMPGQDTLVFPSSPANSQVPSSNTFTILLDRTVAFDVSQLQWTFQTTVVASPPVANAGANQTAPVGGTVLLSGSASTNPSGIGTLTYNWAFLQLPPGSAAKIENPASVFPTFKVDAAGSYYILLTVSNGQTASSARVTVSTSNTAPVAKAGPNQTVAIGANVFLSGSGSFDVDGNPLTYSWILSSRPAGSAAVLSNAKTLSPTFVADKPGSYTAQLTVNDGFVDSTPSSVIVSTLNSPPVADAGPNQTVNATSLVQLNGAASSDVDGDPLTFAWTLITRPAGSTAALSNATSVNPTFTADLPGVFVAQLIVNDGKVASSAATVSITTNDVQAPAANAGANQTVARNATVLLNGSGTDPKGLTLTYLWSITTKPAGSVASLSSTTIPKPSFTIDKPGTYVCQLIVNNGYYSSAPSTVTITTTNTPPVANAGTNLNVQAGATVTLDGSGSSDADNDTLTYSWSFTSRPAGSTAVLTGPTTKLPQFVCDLPGTYVVQLIVNDGFASSNPSTVTVTSAALTLALAPNPLKLTVASGTLTVTSSVPAGPGGLIVALRSGTPSVATVPASITILEGSTGGNVTISPVANGDTVITASSVNFSSATAAVNVNNNLALTSDSPAVGVTRTMNGTITLAGPAPAAGAVVTLTASPSGIVGLQPAAVTIGAGSTSGTFTISGVAQGTATITATSPGYASTTLDVNVAKLGAIKLPTGVSIGPNQSVPYPVSLVTGAPVGGVTITLASSDPAKATIPASVFIAFGKLAPDTTPQVTGVNFGTTTISASAPGFTGDSQSVLVTATLTLSPSSLTIAAGGTQNLTLTLSAQAPAGGTVVNLSSENSSVASVPATVTIPQNSATVVVPVTGGAGSGSTTIHASALPNLADTTASVNVVNFGAISLPAGLTVGAGVSTPLPVTLPIPAPPGGVTVSLSGSDPTKVTVSPATVSIASGSKTPAVQPIVIGQMVGSSTITASAPGFSPATSVVTVTPGLAASIEANAGSPQNAQINTAFAAPLSALVLDANGKRLEGMTVTFRAPVSGPSGTFVPGTDTVTTNVQGIAKSGVFTANSIVGSFTATASVGGVSTPATYSLANLSGGPASMAVTGGTPQSAAVNAGFATVFSVLLKDAGGNPVSGTTVTFTTPATGAGGAFQGGVNSAITDASGTAASRPFTANGTAGSYTVTASVTGTALSGAFLLTNTPGPAASVLALSGTPQSAPVSSAFSSPLKAIVKDAAGNPLSGVVVTFTAPSTGASGSFAGGLNTVTTGADGTATSPVFTANGTFGNYAVLASVPGVTAAQFAMTNSAGAAASIAVTSGTPQSAQINTAFGAPLAATVKDAGGNPVGGVTVTFNTPGNGASATFTGGANTAVTNAQGIATSVVFTANSVAGSYTISASAGSVNGANFAITNTVGSPASISASAGTPQSAPVTTAFSAPLTAVVKDAGGNLLTGVTVTFTAPSSGASGTFAAGANTAVTNGSGVATSTVFTANSTSGSYAVVASAGTGSANFQLTNTGGVPTSIAMVSGTPQSAIVNTAFASTLSVLVKDSNGNPISGVTVTFTAPASGAGGAFTGGANTALTNSSGVAVSAVFTANATAGSYTVTASAGAGISTPFSLTNTPGSPASIAVSSGSQQHAELGTKFPNSLAAIVKDANGNPVGGVTVTFSAPASGASGTFAGGANTAVTSASGIAVSMAFTANVTLGSYAVTASAAGVASPASFSLSNVAAPPGSIVTSGGTPQEAQIGAAFALPLSVLVKDVNGVPLSGVTVAFTVPASGASGTFASGVNTAMTNASGVATSAVFTANSVAGSYVVTAAVGSVTGASFTLKNLVGPPASIVVLSGTPQSTQVLAGFSLPFAVTVKDAGGNLASGVTVTFTAPASGASGSFNGGSNTAVTTASGVATSAAFNANLTAGSYQVTASVTGVSPSAAFALTNVAAPAGSIAASAGIQQSTPINTAFGTLLSALVKDTNGSPLAGATVTFTAPATGASGSFAGGVNTAVTDASGVATSKVFTANASAGTYSVNASAGSVTGAVYTLTNTTGPPATVTVVSGTPQSAQVNAAFSLPLTAIVKDAGGNPVSGASVIFTAPASGPGGTFVNGMSTAASVLTDASGTAVSPQFTAKALAGQYNVTASSGTATSANFAMTNTAGPPASITVAGGTPQSAKISTPFATLLSVTVADSAGNPVNGAQVTFTVTSAVNGAGGAFAGGVSTASTNASGVATAVSFTANSTAGGPYSVKATIAPNPSPSATFLLTNSPGPAATIAVVSGTPQSAVVNAAFGSTLVASVKDSGGNSVSGATVTFTVPATGASGAFQGGAITAVTDSSGNATSAAFTANSKAGAYQVTAASGAATGATFNLTNLAGAAAVLTAVGGTPQSWPANGTFPTPLSASVTDASGNAVSGVVVTFTPPVIGAGGSFASGNNTAVTNNSGVATSALFTANSALGSYSVTASVPGLTSASFSLTNYDASSGKITLSSPTVGQNLQTQITISVSPMAPAGGVLVTLTSSDSSKLLVSGRQFDAGTVSVKVAVPEGTSSISAFVQGVAGSGSVALTATGLAYNPATAMITLTPSGIVVAGPAGLVSTGLTTYAGQKTALAVQTARLDSSLNYVEVQQLRGGASVSVNLTTDNAPVGTVTPAQVSISGGTSSVAAQFNAWSSGVTAVTAATPASFNTPNQYQSLTATVNAVNMLLAQDSATVGQNLQTPAQLNLNGVAPFGGLVVDITSNDSTKLLLSKTATDNGSNSITITIPYGFNHSPAFYVQSLGNSGSATYTATAPNFGSVTGNMAMGPSGAIIAGPLGVGSPSFQTTAGAPNTNVTVYSALLNGSLGYVAIQPVRGGFSANVSVSSSNLATGLVTASPVLIDSGSSSATTQFHPVSSGSADITVGTPAGFSTPAQYTKVTANITTPGMSISDGLVIGKDLQVQASLLLGMKAPSGGVNVTLTSANSSKILLAASPTDPGASSIVINVPADSYTVTYYIQSLDSSGTTGYSASAPGFTGRSASAISLAPSGVALAGPDGLGVPFFSASISSGQAARLTVYAAQLDPMDNSFVAVQALRGGYSVNVSLVASPSNLGTLSPVPVTLIPGSDHGDIGFAPVKTGNTVISVQAPAGFGVAANRYSLTGTVNP